VSAVEILRRLEARARARERELAERPRRATCATCAWWHLVDGRLAEAEDGGDFVVDERLGQCRYAAPPWPITAADDWCGCGRWDERP